VVSEEALRRRAEELAGRPYLFTLLRGDDGVWTSGVLEMSGVISEGDDPNEAIEMAQDALVLTIMTLIEMDEEIAEPFRTLDFSGRLQLRMSPDLHRRATMLAAEQGISLNRWLSQAVAREAGSEGRPPTPPATPAVRRPELRVAEGEAEFSSDRPTSSA
jgi:predicted HicB family RNase H-like nuclease